MATPFRPCGAALLAFLLGAAGCNATNDTQGADGRARFAYESSCVFGCALDHAVMSGSSEDISVSANPGGELPGLTAMTDDPGVASVEGTRRTCVTSTATETDFVPGDLRTPCTPSLDTGAITISARAPGTTTLRLLELDGSLFDSVLLEVATPARVGVECNGSSSVSSIHMSVGETCGLAPVAFDMNGAPLQASQGILVTILDASVVRLNGLIQGSTQQLVAAGAGNTMLVATAWALRAQVPVQVVDHRSSE